MLNSDSLIKSKLELDRVLVCTKIKKSDIDPICTRVETVDISSLWTKVENGGIGPICRSQKCRQRLNLD